MAKTRRRKAARAERIRRPFGSEFDWKMRQQLHFVSRCGRIQANIMPSLGGDYRLTMDLGRFQTPEDARELAHLVMLVLLDPHGFALDFNEFDFSILNKLGGGKMRAEAAAARKGSDPDDVDLFEETDNDD